MKKLAYLLFFLVFFSFLSATPAYSLGISPAKITMNFVPNYEQEFDGTVSNSLEEPREVDLYVDPNTDMPQYVTITSDKNFVVPPKETVPFKFKISLPDSMETPGDFVTILWAEESVEEQAGVALAKVKVGIKIVVSVPYPGKYAAIGLDIKNANVNDTVIFEAYVDNRGKENITKAEGDIKIMDADNRTVAVMSLEGRPVETAKIETLRSTWFSNVEAGLYKAVLTIYYDGKVARHEKEFNLGAPLIKIINVSAEPVEKGSIGKVFTKIKSYWNQEIKDAYVELSLRDENGNEVSAHKGETINVPAFATPVVINYVDTTENIEAGDYKVVMTLHYLDKSDAAESDIKVIIKPAIEISFELIAIIAGLVLAVAVIVMVFMKKRSGKKGKQTKLM